MHEDAGCVWRSRMSQSMHTSARVKCMRWGGCSARARSHSAHASAHESHACGEIEKSDKTAHPDTYRRICSPGRRSFAISAAASFIYSLPHQHPHVRGRNHMDLMLCWDSTSWRLKEGRIKPVPPNQASIFDQLRGKSQTLRHCPPQTCVNYARMSAGDWRSSAWGAGRVAVNRTAIGWAGHNGSRSANAIGWLRLSIMRRWI